MFTAFFPQITRSFAAFYATAAGGKWRFTVE